MKLNSYQRESFHGRSLQLGITIDYEAAEILINLNLNALTFDVDTLNKIVQANPQEIDDMMAMAIRVNDFLSGMFVGIGIELVDFKIEFGRLFENETMRVVLADEISPDSCRLWDTTTKEKLDKDRFRRDLGGEAEAYQEVARRLGLFPEGVSEVLDLDSERKKRGK